MASIGGLSSSTSSSIGSSSLRGYGGLASGLDRDTLIENMTYGTTSKITQQQQKKQQLEWKQAAVRSISDKMIAFGNKYTSTLTASTNLFNANFWGRNKITASGENSKYVSLSGTASSANALTIAAVKQLAQKASVSSSGSFSQQAITSEAINTNETYRIENLVGKSILFSEGENVYSLFLAETDSKGNKLDYSSPDKIAQSINTLLKEQDTEGGKKLNDILKVEVTEDGKNIRFGSNSSNRVSLDGGTALALFNINSAESHDLTGSETVESLIDETKLVTEMTFAEMIDGKTLTFDYNGTSKNIQLKKTDDFDTLVKNLQSELNTAFGKGRVTVSGDGGKLSFKTTRPDGTPDTTSTLTLTGGSSGLLGKDGALKIESGTSNRLDMDAKLGSTGFAGLVGKSLEMVGGKLSVVETDPNSKTQIAITAEDSVKTLMDKINKNTDMTVSYQSAADKLVFTSKENGASGTISMDSTLAKMFKLEEESEGAGVEVRGQDAIVSVKYAGSDEIVDLHRDSNTFTVDGLTIAVKGTFGYDETTKKIDPNAAVGIEASVDEDKIVDNIKSMIDEYNAIVDLVNSELTTKHDKDYAPLTTEQRKELSESEIKNYEDKAKEGLLFGDSDLRMLSSALRTVMSGGLIEEFRKIGITTSSSYSDNGKLELDESKLRSALATNPENVEKLFTSTAGTNADGTVSYNGLATNLKSVIFKYSNPLGSSESKGVLIRKAGSSHSVMSLTDNEIYSQLQEINKMISNLQDRLQSERDRYISQFTSLETLISQMNSQSGWLSSFS
ncbi:MAG: flagellar filament capping protein FliD [Lachnospiraceae bacterium]|nr:flagellar filament capping protein FliD [Lachnospiraceae bacterium]